MRNLYHRRAAAEASAQGEGEGSRKRQKVEGDVNGLREEEKRARKAEKRDARRKAKEERAEEALKIAADAVGLELADGKRRVNREIMKNEGLKKYRRADLKYVQVARVVHCSEN